MGDPSKREGLQALLQEAQVANKARIVEAVAQSESRMVAQLEQSESRMVSQLEQLLLQLQEFIVGFSKNQGRDSEAGVSRKTGDLVNLKQTGSVDEYQRRFQELLARGSKYVRIDQQVSLFTTGLIDSIRLDVEMQNPPNLGHAMNLARAFEKKQKVITATSSRKENWQGTKGYLNTAANATVPTPKSSNTLSGISELKLVSSSAPFIKKLTRAEMVERRMKGLCYNYDELYSIGHQCKKLFWLEVADPDDENPDQRDVQEPEISLHAITGQKSARLMQLRALMEGQALLSLVDSGSTHNFISCTEARHLGMQVQSGTGANVSVANG
ncbi:hypothetical protein FXO37_16030 [Capsicum annuum]|nr:hypothetical protein FXO37_16030 [Capsicum annuum]